MKRISLRTERPASAGSSGERARFPRLRLGLAMAVALGVVVILGNAPAMAQNPTYSVKPRSGGGRAATFGTGPSSPAASGARGKSGTGPMNGAPVTKPQTARTGASRPSIGSPAPKAPLRGQTSTDPNALPKGLRGIQQPKQLKSGQGQGRWIGPQPPK